MLILQVTGNMVQKLNFCSIFVAKQGAVKFLTCVFGLFSYANVLRLLLQAVVSYLSMRGDEVALKEAHEEVLGRIE